VNGGIVTQLSLEQLIKWFFFSFPQISVNFESESPISHKVGNTTYLIIFVRIQNIISNHQGFFYMIFQCFKYIPLFFVITLIQVLNNRF